MVVNRNESARPNLVDPKATYVVPKYIADLWPELTPEQIEQAAILYKDLGSPLEQTIAINSECG